MNQSELPLRREGDPKYQWHLNDIFATNEAWEQEYKALEEKLPSLCTFSGQLGKDSDSLFNALELFFSLSLSVERLYVYACMRRDEDNANSLYQGMSDRAGNLSVRLGGEGSFFAPELLRVEPAKLEEFLSEPRFADYRQFVKEIIRQKEHTLSESEEKLLAMAGDMAEGAHTIFSMLNNADFKFPVIQGEEGEVQITHGRYIPLMESRNRDVRKAAYEGLYGVYSAYRNTLAATLSSSIKKDVYFAQARKFQSARQESLFPDAIGEEIYDNLVASVHRHLPDLHRYMAQRKRILGLDELYMYDLYVPLAEDPGMKFPYSQACSTLLESAAPMGEEYISALKKGLNGGWIDVYENQGKTPGAYSWGVWGCHPYVLLNWNDTLDNAFTLAHEMGHAMHSYYSNLCQPYPTSQYPLVLAEVASTTNETLFMEYMMKVSKAPEQKRYLTCYMLEQIRTTVIRQVMFAEFEAITHKACEQGQPLTADDFCRIYGQLNEEYHGSTMVQDENIAMEWARIPHFYRDFYVYKYALGYSAALAFADMILADSEGRDRYLSFLRAGCSDYPLNILKRAGVDLSTPQVVDACLNHFAKLVDQLEEF